MLRSVLLISLLAQQHPKPASPTVGKVDRKPAAGSRARPTTSLPSLIAGIFGVRLTPPRPLRSGDEFAQGELVIAAADGTGERRLAVGRTVRWPIFGDTGSVVYALSDSLLVAVDAQSGEIRNVAPAGSIAKLIGYGKQKSGTALAITGPSTVGLVSLVTATLLTQAEVSDTAWSSYLNGSLRHYDDTAVYSQAVTTIGALGASEALNVFIRIGEQKAKQVSRCHDSDCGQPSLSPDGQHVVYVRTLKGQ